jgi:HPt (histidine-containing phosphotransfer) domain-containing protein
MIASAAGDCKPSGICSLFHRSEEMLEKPFRRVEKIASDTEFLGKLVQGFCADVQTMLKRLDLAVANARMADVPDITHAIKGAALGIGAQQLAARCIDIDHAASKHDDARLRVDRYSFQNSGCVPV